MKGSDVKLPEFDFKSLSTYGTIEPHTSKSIVGGTPVRFSYVKADKTAVLITALRVFVDFLKTPVEIPQDVLDFIKTHEA